jgi:hypothetical protein
MAACVGESSPRRDRGGDSPLHPLMPVGGCHDVSFIIDFLGSYLFPEGNKRIDEWIATGISLGGTYRLPHPSPALPIPSRVIKH